jgi:hypothetical protein
MPHILENEELVVKVQKYDFVIYGYQTQNQQEKLHEVGNARPEGRGHRSAWRRAKAREIIPALCAPHPKGRG